MSQRMHLRHFQVTGTGHFPLDMLRYDGCFPRRQEDIDLIMHRIDGRPARAIQLSAWYPYKSGDCFTHGRWRSFGWDAAHCA